MLAEALPAAAAAGVPLVTVLVPDQLVDQVPAPRLEDEAAAADPIARLRLGQPAGPRHDPLHQRHHRPAEGRRRSATWR